MRVAFRSCFLFIFIVVAAVSLLTGCGSGGDSTSSTASTTSSTTSGGTDIPVEPDTGGSSSESGMGRSSHNTGRDCVSCHESQKQSRQYVYAGTVYANSSFDQTKTGEVVIITESSGNRLYVTTDKSGNFYTTKGTRGSDYTVTIQGNTVGMVSTANYGGCNSCHNGSVVPPVYLN